MIQHVVILAGGSGTRLWPASKASSPKQLIDLGTGSGGSLFQQTLARAIGLGPSGRVLVVTHESQAAAVREQARAAGAGRRLAVLSEPEARNTAPAICCACAWLEARGEAGGPLLVLPADHAIEPQDRFAAAVEAAAELAAGGRLVVFGVRPTRPETGYGYIEAAEALGRGFVVRSFHEKPDEATARRYLDAGRFYWNSGMFTFTAAAFLEEAQRHAPAVARPFARGRAGLARLEVRDGVVGDDGTLRAIYAGLPSIAVDYAVMEKSRSIAMVSADFE
jgi:mannose-1-phosphate guanylyltransferase/mannose-6-phosphate isomerase